MYGKLKCKCFLLRKAGFKYENDLKMLNIRAFKFINKNLTWMNLDNKSKSNRLKPDKNFVELTNPFLKRLQKDF